MTANNAFNYIQQNLDWANDEQADRLSNPVLSDLEGLVKFDSQKIGRIEIQAVNGTDKEHVYKLDNRFREILIRTRNTEERCISTVDGKLEQVNIHNNTNTFKIYRSLLNAPPVACKFQRELLGEVQKALGKYVSVRGECFYRRNINFPHQIKIHNLEVLPHSEELPTLQDLYGIVPDITGELSSEEFVRQQRDEWD